MASWFSLVGALDGRLRDPRAPYRISGNFFGTAVVHRCLPPLLATVTTWLMAIPDLVTGDLHGLGLAMGFVFILGAPVTVTGIALLEMGRLKTPVRHTAGGSPGPPCRRLRHRPRRRRPTHRTVSCRPRATRTGRRHGNPLRPAAGNPYGRSLRRATRTLRARRIRTNPPHPVQPAVDPRRQATALSVSATSAAGRAGGREGGQGGRPGDRRRAEQHQEQRRADPGDPRADAAGAALGVDQPAGERQPECRAGDRRRPGRCSRWR